jgi:inner membrane protein
MSGWCVADLLELTPRERALAMVAASAADLDGLGLLVSIDYYVEYHHVLAHNLLFGVLLAGGLAAFSTHRRKAFGLYFILFHLHLLLDYFGSGPGWPICYFWPFLATEWQSEYAWELASWQNFLATGVFLGWVIAIAIWRGRTPLEVIMPSLNSKIMQRLKQRA